MDGPDNIQNANPDMPAPSAPANPSDQDGNKAENPSSGGQTEAVPSAPQKEDLNTPVPSGPVSPPAPNNQGNENLIKGSPENMVEKP